MRPSPILLALLSILLLLGLLTAVSRLAEWTSSLTVSIMVWSYLACIAIVILIDGFASRSMPNLKVTRKLDPHLALDVSQSIGIKITNLSGRPQTLQVTDAPPSQMDMENLPVRLRIEADEFADIIYRVKPLRRGLAEFGPITCRVASLFNLWQKKFYFCEGEQSKIHPNYKPLFQSSFLNSDILMSDWGIRLRQRRGEGTDFHQLRNFRIGDSLRQIDWRATARFNRPISREYQEERDQQVVFLLDCGRRMRAKDGAISHFDHALNAVLLASFIALRQGDNVGLLSFAGESRWIAPIKGHGQIGRLLDRVYDLDSSLQTTDFLDVAQKLLGKQPKRSLIIIISSIEPEDRDDLYQATKLLSQHHLVLVASMRPQVLTDARTSDIDSLEEALRYCGASNQMQKQSALYSELKSNKIIVSDTPPSQMHIALVDEYMALKRSGIF
jgi:uncharacterized protein (DUF58 family)